jgi:REP element-mobilizing transposase RayT
VDDEVRLSRIGRIVAQVWLETPAHFPHAWPDDLVLMPNHVHGILLLSSGVGAKHASPLQLRPKGTRSGSLAAVVQAFKSASTRRVNFARGTPGAALWQRGFYEHVVRNDEELNRLRRYIEENPLRWALDRQNPDRIA